jgi:transposase
MHPVPPLPAAGNGDSRLRARLVSGRLVEETSRSVDSSSDKVGAYLGLTPRRYASGETDRAGRISKCGDGLMRTYLVEAAGVLLTRSKATSDLTDWGLRLAKRASAAKARVGVARELSVILLRLWTDNRVFQPRANVITG